MHKNPPDSRHRETDKCRYRQARSRLRYFNGESMTHDHQIIILPTGEWVAYFCAFEDYQKHCKTWDVQRKSNKISR